MSRHFFAVTRVLQPLTALVAVLLLTAACGTVGEGGALRLSDQSTDLPGGLRPLAEGAVGHYCIEKSAAVSGCVLVESVTSENEEVFTVTVEDEKDIYIDALSAGKATLQVETKDGETDSFVMNVRPVKNAIMSITTRRNNATHQHGTLPVTSSLNIPVGEFIDANLSYLIGEDNEALAGVPESIAFGEPVIEGDFVATPRDDGRTWNFEGRVEGASVEITTPYGGAWKLRGTDNIVAADFIASTGAAWRPGELEQKDDTIFAPQGATIFLRFFPVDAEGYAYVGSYDYDAELRLDDAALFSPELRSGYPSTDTINTCVEPIEDQAGKCAKWTNMEQLRIQMHTPRESVQTEIHLKVGDYEKSFTLRVAGDDASSDE